MPFVCMHGRQPQRAPGCALSLQVAETLCVPLVSEVHILMELPRDLQVGVWVWVVGAGGGWWVWVVGVGGGCGYVM